MNSLMTRLALTGLLALSAGLVSAAVNVTYVKPETFYDLPFSPWEREQMLEQLTDYFQSLGKNLPQGQDLRIEVTDFDPAGRIIPNANAGRDLRVLTGRADWPRMELNYAIEQNGQVIKSGTAKLADMNYQQSSLHFNESEPLHYEKKMIDEWFDKTIAPLPNRRR